MSWELKRRLKELRESEDGPVIKDPGGRVNICLVFPNTYYLGMSNLGFTSIYSFLNSFDDLLCERAFMPGHPISSPSAGQVLSVERARSLNDFHLLGFSISFDNDYLNLVSMLNWSNISPLREERGRDGPILFCGGFAPSLNPEPLAEIFDFFILGDGEPPLEEIIDRVRSGSGSKEKFLESLSEIEGVYVPSLSMPEYGRGGELKGGGISGGGISPAISNLEEYPSFTKLFTDSTEFGDMFLIEIARGCPKGCFFCGVGHRPSGMRYLEGGTVMGLAEKGLQKRDRVGLVGSAVLDHPDFLQIGRFILDKGGGISPASIRADLVTKDVASILGESGLKTAALAPEMGNENFRFRMGKAIRDERFFQASSLLMEQGISTVKLYFIAGLPGTTEEDDVSETERFVKRLLHEVRSRGKKKAGLRVVVSMAGFIPKAQTPFQFAAFPGVKRLRSTYKRLRKTMGKVGGVKFEADVPKYSYIQALLSQGDRRISRIIAGLAPGRDVLKEIAESPLNPDYFTTREKGEKELFPWDLVFADYGKEKLARQYRAFNSP